MTEKEYRNIHDWIRRRMKHISECYFCGKPGKLDNALLKGKEHEKNIDNYIKLCRKCHYNYDHPNGIVHTSEVKLKIGEASKTRLENKEIPDSFKYARLGTKISDEQKQIISECMSGEKHHQAKLTENQVIEILKNNTETEYELSTRYNVHVVTIRNIKNRKTWKKIIF